MCLVGCRQGGRTSCGGGCCSRWLLQGPRRLPDPSEFCHRFRCHSFFPRASLEGSSRRQVAGCTCSRLRHLLPRTHITATGTGLTVLAQETAAPAPPNARTVKSPSLPLPTPNFAHPTLNLDSSQHSASLVATRPYADRHAAAMAPPTGVNGVLPVTVLHKTSPPSAPRGSKASQPRLKLVLRRLPPGLAKTEFEAILGDEWKVGAGKIDWLDYKKGKVSKEYVPPSSSLVQGIHSNSMPAQRSRRSRPGHTFTSYRKLTLPHSATTSGN